MTYRLSYPTGPTWPTAFVVLVFAVLARVAATPAVAEDWIPYGPETLGAGGAGVSSTGGSLGFRTNPASLADPDAALMDIYGRSNAGDTLVNGGMGITIEFGNFGDAAQRGDAISQVINWMVNAGNYPTLVAWLTAPNSPQGVDLTNDVTAAFCTIANVASLAETGEGLTGDILGGIGLTVGNFGFHAGGTVHSFAYPYANLAGLRFTDSDGNSLADGLDLNYSPGGLYPFLPAPGALVLSTGAQQLSARFAAAGVSGVTVNGYNRADLLAYMFEINAAETGLSLDSPVQQQAIVDLTTSTGGTRVFGAAGTNPFDGTNSAVRMRAVTLGEFGVSYGHAFVEEHDVRFQAGLTGRLLIGRSYVRDLGFESLEGGIDEVLRFWRDVVLFRTGQGTNTEFNFTMDLGITAAFADRRIRVSLVARNILRPTFNFVDGNQFQTPLHVRFGVTGMIVPQVLMITSDIDLNEIGRVGLPGVSSREFAAGLVFNPFSIGRPAPGEVGYDAKAEHFDLILRVGTTIDLSVAPDWLLGGGVGFRFGPVTFDVGGTISFNPLETNISGNGSRPWSQFGDNASGWPATFSVGFMIAATHSW
ncbi:MAG: conjugal transfer protein TraF [Planctomycetota bacterium]